MARLRVETRRIRIVRQRCQLSTMLKGRAAFRLCPIPPANNAAEIAETVRRLTACTEQESPQSTGPG